jgi:hypothetical protein
MDLRWLGCGEEIHKEDPMETDFYATVHGNARMHLSRRLLTELAKAQGKGDHANSILSVLVADGTVRASFEPIEGGTDFAVGERRRLIFARPGPESFTVGHRYKVRLEDGGLVIPMVDLPPLSRGRRRR